MATQKPKTKRASPSSAISQAVDALSRGIAEMKETVIIARPPIEREQIAAQSEEEIETWTLSAQDQALLDSFDSRLAEAHRGMDRILARLNVE